MSGTLIVSNNLIAQSITLGGVTETSWNFLPLQGYKYVIVPEGTNDVLRGNNLLAAYTAATTLNPSATNRVAVIVPPGNYSFGTTNLVMNTSYVDLIGLVPAQMTTKQVFTDSAGRKRTKTIANVQCPVRIYTAISSGTIVQNVDNVRIESVILSNSSTGVAYYPADNRTNTVLRHVAMNSMRWAWYAGQYVDCVGGDSTFGAVATGTFISCVGGDDSFGTDGAATGVFVDCAGGYASFGGNDVADSSASGTFIDCVGSDASFGGDLGSSGTFIDCVGGVYSFGSMSDASGAFRSCTGGMGSFGGYSVASGQFTDCTGGWNSFGAHYIASGTFTRCTGGGGSFGSWGTLSGTCIDCTDGDYGFAAWGTLATTAKLRHCKATSTNSFGSTLPRASDDFNYNVGGTNTFVMMPNLPTSTNALPSGSVYNSSGTLKVMP